MIILTGLTDVSQSLLVVLQPVVLLQADPVHTQPQTVRNRMRAAREEHASACTCTRTDQTSWQRTHETEQRPGKVFTFTTTNVSLFIQIGKRK